MAKAREGTELFNERESKLFTNVLRRIADMKTNHRQRFGKGEFVTVACDFILQVDWMAKKLQTLTGFEPEAEPLPQVLEEHEALMAST
jgi:hypothetical protein